MIGEYVQVTQRELARLRGIEEAARWHYENSACKGWMQGEVLALALGLDPEAPNEAFARLLDVLHIDHDPSDPLTALLGGEAPEKVYVGPPDGEQLCWTCGLPLGEGQARTKGGWVVHELCPPPTPTEATDA